MRYGEGDDELDRGEDSRKKRFGDAKGGPGSLSVCVF